MSQPVIWIAPPPRRFFELLIKLNSEQGTAFSGNTLSKVAFLVVTHDLALANKLDKQLVMRDGKLDLTADQNSTAGK
ncbi:hypothetical protein PT276_10670 [Orbaceae bacterium ESL0721]|nr:hypothetical protein [Orbaceae bacterium ESL0721]